MGTITRTFPSGFTGTGETYTSVSGARGTSNVGSSAAKREVDEAMVTFEPYQTPILTELLTNKMRRKPTGNQTFEWVTSSLLPRTDTVTLAGGAANEDNITVGDSTLYQVGTKFVNDASGEVCIVDSIASSQVDVTKIGSGNITALSAGTVHFLGDSFEQGSSSATAKSVNKEFPYNYVELFKKSVHETESQQATQEYGPDDWTRNKMDRMPEFKLDLEANFLWGIRDTNTGFQNGTFTQYHTGGVVIDSTANFISAIYDYTTLTEALFFDTFLAGWSSRGSNKKRLYAGSSLITTINNFSKVKQQTAVSDEVYGVRIKTIKSEFGDVELAWHPMLEGTTYAGYGVGLDMGRDYVKYRYLAANGKSRDIGFRDYTNPLYQEQDSRKGEWLGEIGWEIQGSEYHALIY